MGILVVCKALLEEILGFYGFFYPMWVLCTVSTSINHDGLSMVNCENFQNCSWHSECLVAQNPFLEVKFEFYVKNHPLGAFVDTNQAVFNTF